MTKKALPQWIRWSIWPKEIGAEYPRDGGIVLESFEEEGTTTFRTTRGTFRCTTGENGKFIDQDGCEIKMLQPSKP